MIASSVTSSAPAPEKARIRLDFLDGLRGLAALSILLYHLWIQSFTLNGESGPSLSQLPPHWKWTELFSFGSYAVPVFIVLSGFCLMLPIARSGGKEMPGGLRNYLRRRARRILPPYYAALLIFTVAEVGFLNKFLHQSNGPHHTLTLASILAHVFLVHNLNPVWVHEIDSPMWSVATEWQIYFIFPLLLLPLWKKFGVLVPIVVGLMLGCLTLFLPAVGSASLWFIGLFAMGMAGAVLSFSPDISENVRRWPWALSAVLGLALAIGAVYIDYLLGTGVSLRKELMTVAAQTVVGLLTTIILIYLTHSHRFQNDKPLPGLVRFFSARWLVSLGVFSYSIYLIHAPVLSVFGRLSRHHDLSKPVTFLFLLVIAMPVSLGVSYLFHLAFERQFMNMPPEKRTKQTEKSLNPV